MDRKLTFDDMYRFMSADPRLSQFSTMPPQGPQGFRPNDPVAAYGAYDRSPLVSLLLGGVTPNQRVGASYDDLFQGMSGAGGLLGLPPRK